MTTHSPALLQAHSLVKRYGTITAVDGHPLPVDSALTAELNAYLLSPRD